MIWALTNDVMQRLVTFNKRHQKRNLSRLLETCHLGSRSKVLDFGCGTALFSGLFKRHDLDYYGYDIDVRLLTYAARLYPDCAFLSDRGDLKKAGPFELIVANCCFHHIHDDQLAVEIEQIRDLLTDDGTFLLIDLVASEGNMTLPKRLFLKLEQGVTIRPWHSYRQLLEPSFAIHRQEVSPQPFGPFSSSPVHQDLAVFLCRKANADDRSVSL